MNLECKMGSKFLKQCVITLNPYNYTYKNVCVNVLSIHQQHFKFIVKKKLIEMTKPADIFFSVGAHIVDGGVRGWGERMKLLHSKFYIFGNF